MDLIKCSNCGKENNPDAKVCSHCDQTLDMEALENVNNVEVEENDAMFDNEVSEVTTEVIEDPMRKKNKFSKKGIIITAILLVVLIIAGVITGVALHNKKLRDEVERIRFEYTTNLSFAHTMMLLGAMEAEDVTDLISNVWHNAIWEKKNSATDKYTRPNGYFVDDFNDALNNLFSDTSFKTKQSSVSSYKSTVAETMKELMTPVEGYEVAYEKISQLYDAYIELVNLALDPTGSYNSYSDASNNAVTNFSKCYDAAELYVK